MRNTMTEKIAILGVDGMDPKFAKYLMDQGKMPNLKRLVERGAARENLAMLGAMPTVTPPMWTTLATGAYAETHGITAFHNGHPHKIDTRVYALNSRDCRAEQLWNVFAEAGKKTLVWHWPGASWPPTSDSPNLSVVDGTQPAAINLGVGMADWETVVVAREDIPAVKYVAHDARENTGAGCVLTDLDDVVDSDEDERTARVKRVLGNGDGEVTNYIMGEEDFETETLGYINVSRVGSPIKAPTNWVNAPEGAKEFTILVANGYVRRPALILKNEKGTYDRVAIYKSKKDNDPFIVLKKGELALNVVDEFELDGETKKINRNMRIMNLDEDGTQLELWMTYALDQGKDMVWHPRTLYKDVMENVGCVPAVTLVGASDPEYARTLLFPAWDNYCEWQANALDYLMDQYDVIFSHLHNVDAIGHQVWHFAKENNHWGADAETYQGFLEYTYKQTDNYIGKFLHRLDEGWTIILTSDHGLITEEMTPLGIGEGGTNGTIMQDLGYTVFKKDENGNTLRELDLTKTKAIAYRGTYININLKGRYEYGIVDPEDQYELERQIIDDLYNYRDPKTGKRVSALALRRKDAAVFGMSSPDCGDIVYFVEEGFNIIHMDSLSTQEGAYHTSVSPLFVAAGPGIKSGYTTDRVIRQVDVAPTVAVLGGVRMPAQCEGAPVYQILSSEY